MKNQLVKGTIILTVAGLITRMIGFVYRIFLAHFLGDTNLGIYQLIFPVYSLCFTLYAAGIQTAVSQLISHETPSCHKSIMKTGLICSVCTAVILSAGVFLFSDYIAVSFLGIKETSKLLKILSLVFPFCGMTAIINGYFYGKNNATIPAVSQIIEQLVRVFFVFTYALLLSNGTLEASHAVVGLVIGELAAHVFNMIHLWKQLSKKTEKSCPFYGGRLVRLTLPLSGTKLIISLLNSIEAVLIPSMLVRYGYSNTFALAVFGVLTGIVLPFIFFPGTITNSLSVLLLPTISNAAGNHEYTKIRTTAQKSICYSLLLGVVTSCLFFCFGKDIGISLFQNENAGKLLVTLAFICPFTYLSTTLASIINGLGKNSVTFLNTVISLVIRIGFLLYVTPKTGIYGYLAGLMLSQITICLLNGIYLVRNYKVEIPVMNTFVWPMIFCASLFYVAKITGDYLARQMTIPFIQFAGLIPACVLILFYFQYCKLIEIKKFIVPSKQSALPRK